MADSSLEEFVPRKPFASWMESCDGFYEFEVKAVPPDAPWPPMVQFELSHGGEVVGGTLTVDDAEKLAAYIGAAALWAKFEGRRVAAEADRG